MKIRNRDSPVVYICSRYSGDVKQNTEMARRYCRYAVDQGYIPLAPHLLLPQFLSEETERDLAITLISASFPYVRNCGCAETSRVKECGGN